MTTAVQTLNNIATLSPIINVSRLPDRSVDVATTAANFVNDNFRHLINRRAKWSNCATFVALALGELVDRISNGGPRTSETRDLILLIVDDVRDAANRRRAWVMVEINLFDAVAELIASV